MASWRRSFYSSFVSSSPTKPRWWRRLTPPGKARGCKRRRRRRWPSDGRTLGGEWRRVEAPFGSVLAALASFCQDLQTPGVGSTNSGHLDLRRSPKQPRWKRWFAGCSWWFPATLAGSGSGEGRCQEPPTVGVRWVRVVVVLRRRYGGPRWFRGGPAAADHPRERETSSRERERAEISYEIFPKSPIYRK